MKKIVVVFMLIFMFMFSGCSLIHKPNEQTGNIESQNSHKETQEAKGKDEKEEDVSVPTFKDSDIEVNVAANNVENNTEVMRDTTFYYQDKDGLLIPITRKTSRIEGIGKAVINALVDLPIIREDVGRVGLYPVLPTQLQINGMTIKDGVALLDVNEYLLDYSTEKNETNILQSIVYTLTQFHTINSVQLLINGEKIEYMRFGRSIASPLRRYGINSSMENTNSDQELVEVYFTKLVNNKYMYYVPITKSIGQPTSDMDRYMKTLNELIKGDTEQTNLKSYVPTDVKLKGLQVDGQTVILDFNDTILNATHSNTSFNVMLKQIVTCFKQFGKVKKIKITVNGKPLEFTGENEGKEVLEVPMYINQF